MKENPYKKVLWKSAHGKKSSISKTILIPCIRHASCKYYYESDGFHNNYLQWGAVKLHFNVLIVIAANEFFEGKS